MMYPALIMGINDGRNWRDPHTNEVITLITYGERNTYALIPATPRTVRVRH